MLRGARVSRSFVQWSAVVVTLWFSSHLFYVMDQSYRKTLKTVWTARYGAPKYEMVLSADRMMELNGMKKRDYLEGHSVARNRDTEWAGVEAKLESSLLEMFNRTDPMKGWELKKLASAAWRNISKDLKHASRTSEVSPVVEEKTAAVDMSNVLVYNRIPKSGSTLLLGLLYSLAQSLGYLVVRGRYHSYRYWTNNDRVGLGYFLEQAAGRARTVYVQHQYYVNFTENRQQQPVFINMMRDPVEHLVSSYYYKRTVILQHRGPRDMARPELEIMSQPLEQCVVERRLECVYYGYTVHTNKSEQLEFRRTWSPSYLYPSDVLLYFCGVNVISVKYFCERVLKHKTTVVQATTPSAPSWAAGRRCRSPSTTWSTTSRWWGCSSTSTRPWPCSSTSCRSSSPGRARATERSRPSRARR